MILSLAESISRAIWRMASLGVSAEAITSRAHEMNRAHGSPFAASDVDGQVEHILTTIADDAEVSR